ncbi:primosomal replication protein PriC [Bradyrhizobium sp. SZCCHNR3118]|uniref:primosomal replication protein PriC n=1 Tax=Bradyrhizobium sp. SZCCHNR3118 TaxID=3057468 RepID=UPI002916AAAD|nr:primosomal replication protein PriC [Bradyrhizobium sp. SZCCHNR3118]
MDKAIEKAKAIVSAMGIKAIAVLVLLVASIAYAHHRGVASTTDKFTAQVEVLKRQLAEAEAKPAPAPLPPQHDEQAEAQLADRLKQAETAKAALEKKVKDYEKQLAHRPAKAGGFALSPADARSLSNIR